MTHTSFDSLLRLHSAWLFIAAHPGHELRAFHVLERTQASVAVVTDGSGSSGVPRLDDSRALIESVGARAAGVFGAMTDRAAYAALMARDAAPFERLVAALTDEIRACGATAVVIDAAEGYNPVHDVCHWMGRAAIERMAAEGVSIEGFELDLVAHPDGTGSGVRVELDPDAFARKTSATARYESLASEAAAAYEQHGLDSFRVEFLRRLPSAEIPPATWVPYYEEVGEARVRAGLYASALTFGAHVQPILLALGVAGARRHADAVDPSHQ